MTTVGEAEARRARPRAWMAADAQGHRMTGYRKEAAANYAPLGQRSGECRKRGDHTSSLAIETTVPRKSLRPYAHRSSIARDH